MKLVVLADEVLKQELLSLGQTTDAEIVWVKTPEQFIEQKDADVHCDLLFDGSRQRIELLKNVSGDVIVNTVSETLKDLDLTFIRINAWPGFLKGPLIEASCNDESKKKIAEDLFHVFNRKVEWLPDEPGFVSARIVAMIINEAYFALGENVSTKNEIDTAMKFGTNYPYGPFEWSEKIGIKKIHALLTQLAKLNPRYKPASLLEKEALD